MARALTCVAIALTLTGVGLSARPGRGTGATGLAPNAVPAAVPLPPRLAPPIPLARGTFLVARRGLPDPHFAESVVLLIHYEAGGAMGLILNRPSHVPLSELLPEISKPRVRHEPVFLGGPVAHERMLFLLRAEAPPAAARRVFSDVYVSSNRDLLLRTAERAGDRPAFRVFAGRAGWGPSQLDREIARGDWHVITADVETVFEKPPTEIWPALISISEGQVARRTDAAAERPCAFGRSWPCA